MSKSELSFSEALSNLEDISGRINNDEVDVDELSSILKEAASLANLCKSKITKAEGEVVKILKQIDISGEKDVEKAKDESEDHPGEKELPDDGVPF